MASTCISTRLFWIWFVVLLPCQAVTLSLGLPSSTISAAPSLLPNPPLSSPPLPADLSPDITPLFPSPAASELAPTDSSLPLIPSSPSPPNPDAMIAPGPIYMPFSPSQSLPVSSALPLFSSLCTMLLLAFISFFFSAV